MDLTTSMRTDMCGQLTAADAGRTVSVCGWVATRREHGENLAFIDLRDRTGIVQCVVNRSHDLRSEYVAKMTGQVRLRPDDTANRDLPTGEIEIEITDIEILATAEPPPFPLDERTDVDETISTNAPMSTRPSVCVTATSTSARTACSTTCGPGRSSTAPSVAAWRSRASSRSRRRC
jgi:aspartyl/asparaginyl-tRNA synthetase